jgi:hypothetical protein
VEYKSTESNDSLADSSSIITEPEVIQEGLYRAYQSMMQRATSQLIPNKMDIRILIRSFASRINGRIRMDVPGLEAWMAKAHN